RPLAGGGVLPPTHVPHGHGHEMTGRVGERVEDENGALTAPENQSPPIVTGGERGAEDTWGVGGPGGSQVTHPPWCPQTIHSAGLGVDELAEPLADLEEGQAVVGAAAPACGA